MPVVCADYPLASSTVVGLMGITAQTFAGAKTFQDGVIVKDGSLGAPGLAFSGDTDWGLYRASTHIAVVMNGAERFSVDTAGLATCTTLSAGAVQVGAGLSTSASVSCNSDTNTGLGFLGAGGDGTMTLISNGTEIARINATGFSIGAFAAANCLHVAKSQDATAGAMALLNHTTSTVSTSDQGSCGADIRTTVSQNTATNHLVERVLRARFTNSLTGGGSVQNARCFELVTETSASTTTGTLSSLYLIAGTTNGTVTNGRAIEIVSVQGTNKWGIYDSSGAQWQNVSGGLVMGSPTGGDKGSGTINVATDIYKNNTAYTNPDYVLEQYFTGRIERFAGNEGASTYDGLMPLCELREYLRANNSLPRRPAEIGLFSGGDWMLERVEEAYLYILELDNRVQRLEEAMLKR